MFTHIIGLRLAEIEKKRFPLKSERFEATVSANKKAQNE